MKNTIIPIALLATIAFIAFLVLQPIEQKKHTQQEMDNISKALSNQFARPDKPLAQAPANIAPSKTSAIDNNQQSIIGVIYKRPNSTWFFKARDSKERIDAISASFKNYFVDQLKFDQDERPIFSHIPETMNAANTSNMRVATFMLAGVEISVSQLGGQQDVFANVKRWMGQIGLDDNSPIQLDFKDDKKTILVKMPR